MAAADYNRAYRPYAPPAADYDRPYRNEIVPYGDRRIDLVVKPPPSRSPPPPLPVTKSGGGGGIGSAWCFSDPEVKRRRRVASYKAYSVEGKVKASLRRGFRWIKDKCTGFIHGWFGTRSWSHGDPLLPLRNIQELSPFPCESITLERISFLAESLCFFSVCMCWCDCNSLSSSVRKLKDIYRTDL